ncbi:hypothetical protein KIL84_001741 [Mauremys mutica]|uniref:Uncharacterized protein n=1 Tax=Mauremys mutica TaxID=74926 RepID=A0A9D4AY41_9SAUR|nr:hypothetical protein KIL84_001741 [Mauremys mutica]
MGHGLPAGQRLLDLALPRGRDLDPARSQCPLGLTGGVWWVSPADCAQWCRLGSRRTDPRPASGQWHPARARHGQGHPGLLPPHAAAWSWPGQDLNPAGGGPGPSEGGARCRTRRSCRGDSAHPRGAPRDWRLMLGGW